MAATLKTPRPSRTFQETSSRTEAVDARADSQVASGCRLPMLTTHSILLAPVAFSYVSASATTAFSYEDRYASLAFLLEATDFSCRSATRSAAASTDSVIGSDLVCVGIKGSLVSCGCLASGFACHKLAQQLR